MYKTIIQRHIINSTLIRKLLFLNTKKKKSKYYLERFKEYKQSKFSRNIIVQLLPLLLVLAFFYVLSSQNLFFGTVLSGSMEPTFERGDLVLMQSLYGEPAVGDIVMFVPKNNKEPVTHRISRITEYGSIKTRGDANKEEDGWTLNKKNIRAKSVMIEGKPVVISGLGSKLVSRADNFSITVKFTQEKGLESLFQQFRSLTPLIIFVMLVIYVFMVIDTGREEKRIFGRKNK